MDEDTRKLIEHLHRAALERDPDQRATFIEESCAGNDEVRQAVNALLTRSEHGTNALYHADTEPQFQPETVTSDLSTQNIDWPLGPSLGPYKVLGQLGKGAMGVVFLAQDERLGRKIALKMLPAEFIQDQQRLRRFEREARAASALNHPNVITVHEVGEANGIHFIATEFIEGNTLRRVMATEKIELHEKLRIGAQIAAALDSTHRAKVIHRDIKPENIMVRPDGLVKVLDFGLAQLTPERGTSNDHQLKGIVETQGGVWAGTPRYMSPEQVRGLELDSRSDIFSLGVVLYELISGRPPFTSDKAEELFDSICNDQPVPVAHDRNDVPPELSDTIRQALEKDPENRFQTAGELQTKLDLIRQKLERRREDNTLWRRHRAKVAVATVMIGMAAIIWLWWRGSQRPHNSNRANPTITRLANVRVSEGFVSFSPDGASIAYSASGDGDQRIWTRPLEREEEPRGITDGSAVDRYPIWSPDGKRIAFVSNRDKHFGIWVVPASGGAAELLKAIDKHRLRLTSWSRKRNAIYFEESPNLFMLDLDSGTITDLTHLESRNTARSFSVSPDEQRVAFSALVGDGSRILLMPIGGGTPSEVTRGGVDEISPEWMPDGRSIVYAARSRNIYQVFSVDLATREPVAVTVGDSNYQSIALSPDGHKFLALSIKDNANVFYWDEAARAEVGLTSDFGLQLFPEIAPDGNKMLFQATDSSIHRQGAIIVQDVAAKRQPVQILPAAREARWGRDSDLVAFIQRSGNRTQLWVARESGGAPRILTDDTVLPSGWTNIPFNRLGSAYDWSREGSRIAYCAEAPGQRQLKVVSLDGTNSSVLATTTDSTLKISSPIWAPREERIAYVLEPFSYSRTAKRAVYVSEKGTTKLVFESDERLRLLGWSASGRNLFVALGESSESTQPQQVKLLEVDTDGRKATNFATIPAVYLHSLRLAPDGSKVAMAGRQDGRDNLMMIPAGRGSVARVMNNADPTVYYSGLTWSADGKRLFYSKQTSWAVASVVEINNQ